MTIFYPGPSKLYPPVAAWAAEACQSGMVSMNHRSAAFMAITEGAIRGVKHKLAVPPDYHVALVSSATECWEIVAQSLTKQWSGHLCNGAFAQKWYAYTAQLGTFAWRHDSLDPTLLPAHLVTYPETDVLCLTHNETSNGTQLPAEWMRTLRTGFDGIIAVDAVSSMAGVELDWQVADVWFASVQKCFGLPAGLAVLIYSPAALARAEALNDRKHYNSLLFLHENFQKNQTPYTPNGLGIYLLNRVMQYVPDLTETDNTTRRRAAEWYQFFEQRTQQGSSLTLLAEETLRSDTVIAVSSDKATIQQVKAAAQQAGYVLGNGYGDWKDTTFRIANFPAITDEEVAAFKNWMTTTGL
jgi:phosphoserine aminotransferase